MSILATLLGSVNTVSPYIRKDFIELKIGSTISTILINDSSHRIDF